MKKVIFTLFLSVATLLGYSQVTYYWVGGTTPAAGGWNIGTNWNTMQNGSGTERATSVTTDILIFDGSNVGGSSPATGLVLVSLTSQAIGKLIIQGNADVSLTRNGSGGTTTLTIGDDPSGDDLVVFAGSTLRLGVPSPGASTGSLLILLANNAGSSNNPAATFSGTALIYGDIICEDGTNTFQNRFTSRFKGAFVFVSGSTFTTRSNFAYYPFGTSGSTTSTPFPDGVIFQSGSSYFYNGGTTTFGNPFGSNSTSVHVKFEPGSKFYFNAANASNMFTGRSYGDVIIQNNATVTADGAMIRMDSLRIESGSTFITHTSGTTPIMGHILNNGTFRVPAANPDRTNKVVLTGSTQQNISGTGTYTLASFVVSNVSTARLMKSIQVDTSTRVIGILNPNGFATTGPGTSSLKSPASVNQSGNLNVDSFIVKNIADFTGIEVGMQVTGTGVPANTVVVNTSSSSGTITLSKAVTGAVTYAGAAVPLTIFNGQGSVLPVKFGSISAVLQNGKTNISWNILAEENIARYEVERSNTADRFNTIGNVTANGSSKYAYTDENPFAGTNFYRIKAVGRDGDVKYSTILKVNNSNGKTDMLVYPNPVKDGQVSLQISNLSKGEYSIRISNTVGQVIATRVFNHMGGSINQTIELPLSARTGVYNMQVIGNGISLQQKLIVQ